MHVRNGAELLINSFQTHINRTKTRWSERASTGFYYKPTMLLRPRSFALYKLSSASFVAVVSSLACETEATPILHVM